nr:PREDICTED: BRICHOS domain-containing protein 5 [Latimeria chalumnae]|eukprot:XP_014343121.1 PREDICTED: BRICHOS domain-containing protein 5 [Latimeria chalumnae]
MVESKTSFRIFWGSLTLVSLFAVIVITVLGILRLNQTNTKLVRITFQDHQGSIVNQSAFVEKQKDAVTYYVTSQSNQTTVILFDSKNEIICYKPAEQEACFLRKMEHRDLENVQAIINVSEHRVEHLILQRNHSQFYREFLGIMEGSQVDPQTVGKPIQHLCDQLFIYWAKKSEVIAVLKVPVLFAVWGPDGARRNIEGYKTKYSGPEQGNYSQESPSPSSAPNFFPKKLGRKMYRGILLLAYPRYISQHFGSSYHFRNTHPCAVWKSALLFPAGPLNYVSSFVISVIVNTIHYFTYLGSTLSPDSGIDQEIQLDTRKASSAVGCLQDRIFDCREIQLETKIKVH